MDPAPASPRGSTPQNESPRLGILRRVALSVALAAVAWLAAWYAPHRGACWRVHAIDWAFRQRAFSQLGLREIEEVSEQARRDGTPIQTAIGRRLDSSRTAEQKWLASLPPNEFIKASTKGRSIDVSGQDWSAFFQTAEDALARRSLPPQWAHAVDGRSLRNGTFHSIFLKAGEAPLASLPSTARDGRPWYLRLEPGDDRFLEIEWTRADRDQGQEIGPYDFPTYWRVPEIFRWPFRHRAAWLAALAAALPFAAPALSRLRALGHIPRPSAAGAYTEMARRVALFGISALAIALAFWTHLKPYWILQPPESRESARKAWVNMAMPLVANSMPEAREDPSKTRELTEQIFANRDEPDPKTLEVEGEEWRSLFASASAVFAGGPLPDGWVRRVDDHTRRDIEHPPPYSGPPKPSRLIFWRDERPLVELAPTVKIAETYQARLKGNNTSPLLLSLISEPEIAGFGHANFGVPTAMAYPLRPAWPWLVSVALAVYILLPRRRIDPDTIAWPTWRLALSDFASALLFIPFFGLPLMIIGSTQAALTFLLPFTAIFWILAALGAYLILWVIRYACWSVRLLPDAIVIENLAGRRTVRFDEIIGIQRAELKPPKWLVVLSFLAALLPSRGSARIGQTGRAMLLASSSASGLILRLRKSPSPILWFTDQMGSVAVKNFKRLTDALEKHQIPRIEEVIELRRITPPDEIPVLSLRHRPPPGA